MFPNTSAESSLDFGETCRAGEAGGLSAGGAGGVAGVASALLGEGLGWAGCEALESILEEIRQATSAYHRLIRHHLALSTPFTALHACLCRFVHIVSSRAAHQTSISLHLWIFWIFRIFTHNHYWQSDHSSSALNTMICRWTIASFAVWVTLCTHNGVVGFMGKSARRTSVSGFRDTFHLVSI